MKIQYRQPYWVKFEWDIKEHPDDQYVTYFNKHVNNEFIDFLFNKKFVIHATFKIEKSFERDEISMVYGKPGKPIGLSYNTLLQSVAFEYWVTVGGIDEFRSLHVMNVNGNDVQKGVTITIIRNGYTLICYKNFVETNRMDMGGEFVEDYRTPELFLGCASPQSYEKKHRYHCEVEYDDFSIIKNVSDIEEVKVIQNSKNEKLINNKNYNNILCLYNFETINNIGVVYDESKNTNFLEKVPVEFVL